MIQPYKGHKIRKGRPIKKRIKNINVKKKRGAPKRKSNILVKRYKIVPKRKSESNRDLLKPLNRGRDRLKPKERVVEPFDESSEGKCFLNYDMSSSDEENATVKRTRKQIGEEKRDNRRPCQNKNSKRNKSDLRRTDMKHIKKHAKQH